MIKWTSDLSVNNLTIDNEHKHLFILMDRFYQGIMNKSPKLKLEELILGLVNYTQVHFTNEEIFMQQIGFTGLERHKKQHQLFITKINEFYNRLKSGKMILSLEVTNFLKDWLVNHIKGSDQEYACFARSQRGKVEKAIII